MQSRFLIVVTICFLFMSSCANQITSSAPPIPTIEPTASPTSTPAPDLCSVEHVGESIKGVNDLMREFDDMSKLAANLERAKLPELISQMQRVRRAAEDQEVPGCLSTLKMHQISHMNLVIDTLIAFLGGAQPETLNDGIARAGQAHDLYTLEVARLLGIPQATPAAPATNTP